MRNEKKNLRSFFFPRCWMLCHPKQHSHQPLTLQFRNSFSTSNSPAKREKYRQYSDFFFITSRTSILGRFFYSVLFMPPLIPPYPHQIASPIENEKFLFFCINRLFFLLRCIFFLLISFTCNSIYDSVHDDDGNVGRMGRYCCSL